MANYPATKKTFPNALTIAAYGSLGAGDLPQILEDIGVTLGGLQDRAGTDDVVDETALIYRIARAEAVTEINVERWGILPGAGLGAVNTYALAVLLSSTYLNQPVDFLFPSRWGSYEFAAGINVAQGSVRLLGRGKDWTELVDTGAGGVSNPFIQFNGTDTADFSGRLAHCGVEKMQLRCAAGAADTTGLSLKHGTHHHITDVQFEGWRRHALYGGNVSDSWFDRLEFDFCGSFDDSNLAAIHFDPGGSAYWAGDANKWYGLRVENCGDRQLHLDESGAGQPNKHVFTACKFENSNTNGNGLGGTLGQLVIVDGSHIVFQGCDFTLQGLRTAHAVIPAAISITGSAPSVYLSDCQFSFGAGSLPKCFTSLVDITGANSTLVMSNVTGYSGNTSAFPTQFVKATSTPTVGLKNVGWVGPNRGSGPAPLSGAVASLAY